MRRAILDVECYGSEHITKGARVILSRSIDTLARVALKRVRTKLSTVYIRVITLDTLPRRRVVYMAWWQSG